MTCAQCKDGSTGLSLRPMNLRFTPETLQLVRAQLVMLASTLDARYLEINQLYSHIEHHCFTYYGLGSGNQWHLTMEEQWTSFLLDSEKEVSSRSVSVQTVHIILKLIRSRL
jgi:hypothetical protein